MRAFQVDQILVRPFGPLFITDPRELSATKLSDRDESQPRQRLL